MISFKIYIPLSKVLAEIIIGLKLSIRADKDCSSTQKSFVPAIKLLGGVKKRKKKRTSTCEE